MPPVKRRTFEPVAPDVVVPKRLFRPTLPTINEDTELPNATGRNRPLSLSLGNTGRIKVPPLRPSDVPPNTNLIRVSARGDQHPFGFGYPPSFRIEEYGPASPNLARIAMSPYTAEDVLEFELSRQLQSARAFRRMSSSSTLSRDQEEQYQEVNAEIRQLEADLERVRQVIENEDPTPYDTPEGGSGSDSDSD